MPEISERAESDEVKRARAKYLKIKRTERALLYQIGGLKCPHCGGSLPGTIDWEYDVLKPGLQALEQRTVVVGELPKFEIADDEDTD